MLNCHIICPQGLKVCNIIIIYLHSYVTSYWKLYWGWREKTMLPKYAFVVRYSNAGTSFGHTSPLTTWNKMQHFFTASLPMRGYVTFSNLKVISLQCHIPMWLCDIENKKRTRSIKMYFRIIALSWYDHNECICSLWTSAGGNFPLHW